MPPALLKSQFDALEEPRADERAITVAIDAPPEEIAGEGGGGVARFVARMERSEIRGGLPRSRTYRGILIPSARSAADMTVARAFVRQKSFTFVAARAYCARSTTVLLMLEL